MSSNIPKARRHIATVLKSGHIDPASRRLLRTAFLLMFREPPIRRAPKKYRKINADMRRRIHKLEHSDLTMQDIAVAVGLRSSGRVSEVLHGKR